MTPRFPALRFLLALKAARDFGLDSKHANEIALRFDVRKSDRHDELIDDLASTLLKTGAVAVPDHA